MEEAPASRVTVMVVEDDPDVAKSISRKLTADGCEIELADEPFSVLARLDAGEGDNWTSCCSTSGCPE